MKKVLSVLLAAAMVMGMSVSAFAASADKTWGSNSDVEAPAGYVLGTTNNKIDFANVLILNGNYITAGSDVEVKPGDDLYFPLDEIGYAPYALAIDKDWSINIKGNSYVEKAYFVAQKADGTYSSKAADLASSTMPKFVKVEIADELDDVASKEVKFFIQLVDDESQAKSSTVKVVATFANLGEYTVDFDWSNDVDEAGVWKVAKNTKGTAVFDFEDEAYVTVKMVSEEKVVLNLSMAYDKAIDKAYNEYDADLSFYNFKGSKDAFTKTAELLIPADEDTYIYEIVDGELVEIEAVYDDEYKLEGTNKSYAGWIIETKELGYYVVADEELVVAEVETEVEAEVEAEKANPETGAADFVGAAVAMAVVSVAAAGALALKK
ncbi:MAG: hypothetical protein E7475_04820 [Ruminococcaceae bacterium]|nr:hypothetical protein [Oscillospiraceae bacterium]